MVMFNLDGYVFLSKRKVCMACILRERKCGVQQRALARVLHERKYDFQQCGLEGKCMVMFNLDGYVFLK